MIFKNNNFKYLICLSLLLLNACSAKEPVKALNDPTGIQNNQDNSSRKLNQNKPMPKAEIVDDLEITREFKFSIRSEKDIDYAKACFNKSYLQIQKSAPKDSVFSEKFKGTAKKYVMVATSFEDLARLATQDSKIKFAASIAYPYFRNPYVNGLSLRTRHEVFTFLLLDRILWDRNGNKNIIGPQKTSLILAHEVYGSGKLWAQNDIYRNKPFDPFVRLAMEINAYESGIKLGGKILKSSNNLPKEQIEGMKNMLEGERYMLKGLNEIKKRSKNLSANQLQNMMDRFFQSGGQLDSQPISFAP